MNNLVDKMSSEALTISNALQWRLQYGRIVQLQEQVSGTVKIV